MSDIPTISAGEWLHRTREGHGQSIAPLHATLEFTERCNLRCAHCYIKEPACSSNIRKRELTIVEWRDILDQMERAGIIWLQITGGEPLLRKDFSDLYLYAKRKGFYVILLTNGTLLTPDMADFLAANPPWQTEITLYGATAKVYEAVTGIPGSYDLCIQGIELLLARDIALNVKTMALTLNIHEINTMKVMAKQWGLNFRYDANVHARINGDVEPVKYRLSPEEISVLEEFDIERMQQLQDFCTKPWDTPDPKALFSCGAGTHTFHIDAYGGLYPCLRVRWLHYNLRENSLERAINTFLLNVRKITLNHNYTCRECEIRIICQICPGWAYLQMGDPEAPDPFRCQVASLREEKLKVYIEKK